MKLDKGRLNDIEYKSLLEKGEVNNSTLTNKNKEN